MVYTIVAFAIQLIPYIPQYQLAFIALGIWDLISVVLITRLYAEIEVVGDF